MGAFREDLIYSVFIMYLLLQRQQNTSCVFTVFGRLQPCDGQTERQTYGQRSHSNWARKPKNYITPMRDVRDIRSQLPHYRKNKIHSIAQRFRTRCLYRNVQLISISRELILGLNCILLNIIVSIQQFLHERVKSIHTSIQTFTSTILVGFNINKTKAVCDIVSNNYNPIVDFRSTCYEDVLRCYDATTHRRSIHKTHEPTFYYKRNSWFLRNLTSCGSHYEKACPLRFANALK